MQNLEPKLFLFDMFSKCCVTKGHHYSARITQYSYSFMHDQ